MAANVEILEPFDWCSGQGRFGPGALNLESVDYPVGGVFGALAFTLECAFYWAGGTRNICRFLSPLFQPMPGGGCNAETNQQCVETLSQLDFGALAIDSSGGLYFTGNSYAGGGYTPLPFTAASSTGPKAIAYGWNSIELKMELGGVVMGAGGSGCGAIDADPGAYGLLAARINGSEVMRFRVRDGDIDKCSLSTCACFLCEQVPLGVGVVRMYAAIYGGQATRTDDLIFRSWDMTEGEDAWIGDHGTALIPVGGAGSAAGFTPVGAATNWQAAVANDASYNRTNETGKRDALALAASADTSTVSAAQPVVWVKSEYHVGGGPPMKAFYRRGGVDYATETVSPLTTFSPLSADAGVPVEGETVASLSAGEIGYTTE